MYGPPRTGKTRQIDAIVARNSEDRSTIQIHDGWGYDHLVEGLKPDADGHWAWADGPLKSAIVSGRKYIVLEEINRTAISQALGEVFSLIEDGYRGESNGITLRSGQKLWIPFEECIRQDNPVGRGRYTQGGGFGGARSRALVPHFTALPWIPVDAEWRQLLQTARSEPLRNRVMLALAYDAGLRREELCLLATGDIDPAHRLLTVRAETTKSRRGRVIPYSEAAGGLLSAYLAHRRTLTKARGPLFVSESRRNAGEPLSFWTWSKVVHSLANRAGLPELSTHTGP